MCGTTENQGTLTCANPTHHPTASRASLSRGQPRPPASPWPRCTDTPTVRSGRGTQGGLGARPRVSLLPVQQEEFRAGLPLLCGTHSWSVGGRPRRGQGGGSGSEESVRGAQERSTPPALSLRGTARPRHVGVLVTHKGITVILLTLTLELLLEDGNRCRRLIKNAPDFP